MKIRNRIALLIVMLFVVGTGTVAAYQSQPKTVTVVDGGKVTQYETAEALVGEFLASEDIILGNKDKISEDISVQLKDEMKITIERWNPVVTMILDKKDTKVNTKAYTVGEFLKEQGVVLGSNDIVEPNVESQIKENMSITIQTEKILTENRKEVVHYKTEVRPSSKIKYGERQVEQTGINGIVEKTYNVKTFNGESVEESLVETKTLVNTQNEIVLEGIKNTITDPKTGKVYEYTKELAMEATAYTDIPNDRWNGITASGMPTFVGMVAVDKRTIPLGTKLYVEGYGIAHAGDTGGAVKGNIIDLYMNTHNEAMAFGRRARKVYILKDQNIDVRQERRAG